MEFAFKFPSRNKLCALKVTVFYVNVDSLNKRVVNIEIASSSNRILVIAHPQMK